MPRVRQEPLIWNKEAETMPRAELEKVQLKRLQDTVERCYHKVPFYKRVLDEKGIKPGDIKSLEDLRKLPFTSKQDLRDNYPWGMFAVPVDDLVEIHATSGTTGKMTVTGYTRQDLDLWAETMARVPFSIWKSLRSRNGMTTCPLVVKRTVSAFNVVFTGYSMTVKISPSMG